MVLQIFEIIVTYKNIFSRNKKISFGSKIHVFAPQNYGAMQTLPRKVMKQCRLCPAKSQSLHSLPHKIKETLFFSPQNYGAMQTLLRKIAETQFQGPTNILKLKFPHFFSNYFCKSLLFQIPLQPFGPLFKEKNILCHGTFKMAFLVSILNHSLLSILF